MKPALIDFIPVINSAVEVMKPAAEAKRIALRSQLRAEPTMIHGDAARLTERVANVIGNAIKFTPKRGHIDVTLDLIERGARLIVSDDGEGIDPEFLPQIFQRFTQGRPSTGRIGGGLGLGLSIVKHVLELHDGTIAAFSEGKGRGASFTIVLPLAEPGPDLAAARG